MIRGGYILQPRKIDESDIMDSPPHIREIWIYILRKANHSDNNKFKRGQLFTSYKQIIDDLSWHVGYRKESYRKHHCEIAMKALTKKNMITTTKTTRGLIITVCNYDYYQDPKNYEYYNEVVAKTTRKLQSNDTINKNDKKEKNDNNKELKFNFKKSLLDLGVNEEILGDWMEVRKNKKASNTKTAFTKFINQVNLSGLTVNECVKICAERDWKGFEAQWLKNIKINGSSKTDYKINPEIKNNPNRLSFD